MSSIQSDSVIESRAYQVEAVRSIYDYFGAKTGNPVLALPTGTGKSVVIALFLDSVYRAWPNQKVLILTHVKELIKQNFTKLKDVWTFAPAGIYSAGLRQRDKHSPIVFAGIASVAKRWAEFGRVDLVIIDEAHLLSPKDGTMYQNFLDGLRSINPALKVIGFTATPYRLQHGHIADGTLFDDVCFDITHISAFNRLIAEGYLSPLIPKNPKTLLRTDGVRIQAGEYNLTDLQIAVDRTEVTYAALKEALEEAHDRQHWLIFSSGIQHGEHIVEMLESFGEKAAMVHSRMPGSERDENIAKFQRGELRMLVNNNILTTGFDSPWVDCIVCLRPTASSVLWVQMLGRGTRPFLGNEVDPRVKKNCLALDFAGNTRRLGPINDPVVPRKKGEGTGEAPVKICPVCDTWNHASVRHCVFCLSEFKFEIKIKPTSSTVELLKGDLPIVKVFKVDHVSYRQHNKVGRPPMVKATYYCGLKSFDEYICIEHGQVAGRKARQWWRTRSDNPMPQTTAAALEIIDELPPATHLRIWTNKQYPEILSYCFDGTAFNTQGPTAELPQVSTDRSERPRMTLNAEDDIPF